MFKKGFKWLTLKKRKLIATMKYVLKTYYNQKIRDILFKVGFVLGVIWLVFSNWSLITQDKKIYKEGLLLSIQTPTNLFVFKLVIVYALATVAYFLVRLPFQKIESLKLGSSGLEYKVATEKANDADETLTTQREAENTRLNILNTITTPEVLNSVKNLVYKNEFDKYEIYMYGGIYLISRIMQANLLSSLDINIYPSVIGVIDGVPDPEKYKKLKVNAQILINEIIMSDDNPWLLQEGKHTFMVIRFRWKERGSKYCILCLESDSSEWTLGQEDYMLLNTAWNIIKRALELYSRKNGDIIVSEIQAIKQGGETK